MSTQRTVSPGRTTRNERGDPSEKALKATIVVCLVGLIAVYLFAFSPAKGARPSMASASTQTSPAKEAVASFDRQSLSTKSR